ALYQCYIVMPPHGVTVLALWTLHTHVADVADYTPYIHLSSPVRGCGKSTVQQLLEHTAYRACRSDGITAAALYRRIDRMAPTMLLDELDTRLRGDSGELLRGVLNSGFQRGGRITICVGDDHEERDFRTFCPKCLAGIGRLWDTVASRSIALRMEKASRAELKKLAKLRGDRVAGICEPHRRKLQRWANDVRAEISGADPQVPDALEARQADVWRPLLAVADLAEGAWPERARTAALALSGIAQEEGDYGLLLLEDVHDLFLAGTAIDGDKLPSERIVLELGKREDRPWPEFRRDKPITATQLAKLLGRFGIKPHNLRLPLGEIVKGYRYADCQPAFDRYLQIPAASAATSATSSSDAQPSTGVADVAARLGGIGNDAEYELAERMGMRDD
ncbi:MAG TPA: DUF3631 domain-containing protein, partial [Gemmatimonadaceae bacterium]|nr:DUF3631 domain-containing protein [Gemmatimonadaceae bacterium]